MKDYKLSEIRDICKSLLHERPNCQTCPFITKSGECPWFNVNQTTPWLWHFDNEEKEN